MRKILFALLFLVFALTSVACVCVTSDANNCSIVVDSIIILEENTVADNIKVDNPQIADIHQKDANDKQENETQKLESNKTKKSSQNEINDTQKIKTQEDLIKERAKDYLGVYHELMNKNNPLFGIPDNYEYNFDEFIRYINSQNPVYDTLIIYVEVYNTCVKNHDNSVYHYFGNRTIDLKEGLLYLLESVTHRKHS